MIIGFWSGTIPGGRKPGWRAPSTRRAAGWPSNVAHRYRSAVTCIAVIRDQSRQCYLEIIGRLRDRGAAGVIAGCTEIELLVTADDAGLPYFPTTRLHALAAVDLALSDS
jgi:hypothetical protein